jgi:hypothetical protein
MMININMANHADITMVKASKINIAMAMVEKVKKTTV